MMFKFVCLLAFGISLAHGRCNLTAEPIELIDCLSHMSTILLGLAKNDIARVCRSTAQISRCAQGYIADCVGQQIGFAAFREIIGLSENCCPDRNQANCSIRESIIKEQRCFAADSLVTLTNGQSKQIADLTSGDTILAYNDASKKIVNTPVLTMLDFQPRRFALFKQIITATGRQLSLTSSHLLPTEAHGYVMAKDVHTGMSLFIMNEDSALISDQVLSVSDVVKQGYAAPLTQEGTLIVNNVAASCYATIKSHQVAHSVLAPIRWWYSVFGLSKASSESVHWFPQMLYEITTLLVPSIIHA